MLVDPRGTKSEMLSGDRGKTPPLRSPELDPSLVKSPHST
jgi:hypothetical protein